MPCKFLCKRIKKICQNLELSQEEFGKKLKAEKYRNGVEGNIISNWEQGKARPPLGILVKIAELGKVSLEWLITGKDRSSLAKPYELGEMVQIPILAQIPAGFPEEIPQEDEIIGYTLVDKEFAIVVKGNCMNPTLQDGDEVIFDPSIEPRNGDIVVARIGNDRYEVRRFFKEKISGVVGHNRIELRPEDEIGYKPIEITPDMGIDVQIVGVVVRAIRDFKR